MCWECVGLNRVNPVRLIKIFYSFYKRIQRGAHYYSKLEIKSFLFLFLKIVSQCREPVLNLSHYLTGSMNAPSHYHSVLPRRSGDEERKGINDIGLSNRRGGRWVGIWERELRGWDLGEIYRPARGAPRNHHTPPPSPIAACTMRRNLSILTMLFLQSIS